MGTERPTGGSDVINNKIALKIGGEPHSHHHSPPSGCLAYLTRYGTVRHALRTSLCFFVARDLQQLCPGRAAREDRQVVRRHFGLEKTAG